MARELAPGMVVADLQENRTQQLPGLKRGEAFGRQITLECDDKTPVQKKVMIQAALQGGGPA